MVAGEAVLPHDPVAPATLPRIILLAALASEVPKSIDAGEVIDKIPLTASELVPK